MSTNKRLISQKMTALRDVCRRSWLVLTLTVLSGGCQSKESALPVVGVVNWSGGDLSGHFVEVSQTGSQNLRGFGSIEEDGRFRLSRLVDRKNIEGLPPGNFKVRILLNDEGDGVVKKPKVPARYLDFKTSGWTVQVPMTGDVRLNLPAK